MGELIAYGKLPEITFQGLFERDEVFRMIDEYFSQQGFSREEKAVEARHDEGKLIYHWKGAYSKKMTDYVKVTFTIDVTMTIHAKRTLTLNGREKTVEEGEIVIKGKAEGESDYEKQWEGSGLKWFFRLIAEHYWLKRELGDVKKDVQALLKAFSEHVKDYFAIHRYRG